MLPNLVQQSCRLHSQRHSMRNWRSLSYISTHHCHYRPPRNPRIFHTIQRANSTKAMSDINELFQSVKAEMPESLRENAWYIVAVSQTLFVPVTNPQNLPVATSLGLLLSRLRKTRRTHSPLRPPHRPRNLLSRTRAHLKTPRRRAHERMDTRRHPPRRHRRRRACKSRGGQRAEGPIMVHQVRLPEPCALICARTARCK